MEIRNLVYFVEVAKQKSFSKAGEDLHVTQPTISKMVKILEDELGVNLFDRTSRKVELTDAGKIVFKEAQKIINSLENLNQEVNAIRKLKKGKINIGLPPMVGANFFPKILGEFSNKYPGVNINLAEYGSRKVMEALENGEIDIGFIMLPVDEEKFFSKPFIKEKIMLIVHPSHPLAKKKVVKLKELKDESFISFQKSFALYEIIRKSCVQEGFEPHIIFESSQWDFIAEMVASNLGVALLPRPICEELDKERVVTISLTNPTLYWDLAMVWLKGKYLSFAAREWINFFNIK